MPKWFIWLFTFRQPTSEQRRIYRYFTYCITAFTLLMVGKAVLMGALGSAIILLIVAIYFSLLIYKYPPA